MATLTIGCFPGLVGNMTYDFALKLAEAAVNKGHKVNLW
ncbi:MAG: sulfur reduction protein DsrE, partial [Nitrospirae bacterium]|nr:sulfur reduction protein DsrE [Nitrospirota bacterium]